MLVGDTGPSNAMDFVEVPRSNYTDAANLYTDGVTLYTTSTGYYTGTFRFTRTTDFEVRMGIYSNYVVYVCKENASIYSTLLATNSDSAVIFGGPYTSFNGVYNGWNYRTFSQGPLNYSPNAAVTIFKTLDDCLRALTEDTSTTYPIEYVMTHVNAQGPTSAAIGQDVVVTLTPNDGYKLTSVTVEDEAGPVPFIRDGDTIAFTMPGPIDA